jgi:hypothetical protein
VAVATNRRSPWASQYFHRLEDALQGLGTDPATAGDPIKGTFLFDG